MTALFAIWSAVPWKVKAAIALAIAGIVFLRIFGRRKAAEALAQQAKEFAEDRLRRNEAGRKAAADEARETKDASPEDIVQRIRERDNAWR